MEQLSLFDLDKLVEEIGNAVTVPSKTVNPIATPAPKPVKKEEPAKPVFPKEELERINNIRDLSDLCQYMSTDTCYLDVGESFNRERHGYSVDIRGARTADYSSQIKEDHFSAHIHVRSGWEHSEKQTMVFFDKDGNAWWRSCNIEFLGGSLGASHYHPAKWDVKFTWEGKWRLMTSLPTEKIIFLQTYYARSHIFHDAMPYTFKYSRNEGNKYSQELLMMCPQIELLDKAGYKFVEQLRQYPSRIDSEKVNSFNRLIKFDKAPGKIQKMFKTTSTVCKILKEEQQLTVWDRIRKLDKFSETSPDELQQIYDNNYNDKSLQLIQRILNQKHENKAVFTFSTLVNYLQRLDQYEAIGTYEALTLISDYLESCRLLEMKPRIDGDSLKREHDVAARLVRQKRNEIEAQKMANGCKKLQEYNYENEKYIIRGVRDYDDLLNEAKQQHNCVASYSSRIASGHSLIFVMRRKESPNRSYVTIELSPDLLTVRQKFMAYNQPIRDKETTEFINEWQEHCKDVKKGVVKPHILEMDIRRAALEAEKADVENEVDDDIDL